MCTLNHPNIIRLYEFFDTQKHLNIVMNLAKGQPLLTELENHKQDYTLKRIVKIIWQLCKAIRHLKAKEIIWCNFNHNNIIYDGENIVICGFSPSRVKVSRELRQANTILGLRGRLIRRFSLCISGNGPEQILWSASWCLGSGDS